MFLNTLYLQDVRGTGALPAGLMIIPLAVGQGVSANVSGRLLAVKGARLPLSLGGGLLAVGALLLMPLTVHTSIAYLLVTYAVFGLGAGLAAPPVTHTAVSGLPRDQAGVAGAVASSGRQFGIAIGVAVTGSIVARTGADFIAAGRAAWLVLAACGLLAMLLGLMSTSRWALATARRNGDRLASRR
ncbi:MFS transporter [Microlunatus endophyticus]